MPRCKKENITNTSSTQENRLTQVASFCDLYAPQFQMSL